MNIWVTYWFHDKSLFHQGHFANKRFPSIRCEASDVHSRCNRTATVVFPIPSDEVMASFERSGENGFYLVTKHVVHLHRHFCTMRYRDRDRCDWVKRIRKIHSQREFCRKLRGENRQRPRQVCQRQRCRYPNATDGYPHYVGACNAVCRKRGSHGNAN